MKIIAVLPAYNVEGRVGEVIEKTKEEVDEVIVVDDGSADRTAQIARGQGVEVVSHIINRGYGAALITGSELALKRGAEIIVHIDADGQHDPGEIKNLIELIRQGGADIVLGSRFLNPNNRVPRTKKYLLLKPAIYLNRLIYSNKLTDTHNGFRAFSRESLLTLELTQSGMAYCSELLAQIKKHRLRVKEVPVTVKYYEYGQGPGGGVKIIKDLIFSKWS